MRFYGVAMGSGRYLCGPLNGKLKSFSIGGKFVDMHFYDLGRFYGVLVFGYSFPAISSVTLQAFFNVFATEGGSIGKPLISVGREGGEFLLQALKFGFRSFVRSLATSFCWPKIQSFAGWMEAMKSFGKKNFRCTFSLWEVVCFIQTKKERSSMCECFFAKWGAFGLAQSLKFF